MDNLKIVGIDSKGYGKVYKIVMRNPDISLTAKAIYAYFCSYAGSGNTAFPKRDKITRDLSLTKNTFTKHLGYLIESKYIARTRTSQGNIYEILTRVPGPDGKVVDIKSKGYGTVPKFAMLDNRLTAQAKAVYAYFCSYAGAGNSAYPHRGTILRELDIGASSYYSHYNLLIDCGYITPTQGISEKGQFGSSTYKLNEILGIDPGVDPDAPMSQKTTHGGATRSSPASSVMSQKSIHGQEAHTYEDYCAMSQKSVHGERNGFSTVSTVENFPQNGAMSQKPISRKTAHGKTGHPYTMNNMINNISSYEEKINNTGASAEDEKAPVLPVFTKQMVNDAIDYNALVADAVAHTSLKDMLGHFATEKEKTDFNQHQRYVVKELATQIYNFLNRTEPVVLVENRQYNYADLRANLIDRLKFHEMADVCADIADRYGEIRDMRRYVKRVVLNLATKNCYQKS